MTGAPLQLSRGLKLTAGYFLLSGAVGVAWQLLGIGYPHPGTLAYRIGAYPSEIAFNMAFIVIGVSILRRRSWVPIAAYVTLAYFTFYAGYEVALGFSDGQPSGVIVLTSIALVGAWNLLWGTVVYRNREVLEASQSGESAA